MRQQVVQTFLYSTGATTTQTNKLLLRPVRNPGGTQVEPRWNPGGTQVWYFNGYHHHYVLLRSIDFPAKLCTTAAPRSSLFVVVACRFS